MVVEVSYLAPIKFDRRKKGLSCSYEIKEGQLNYDDKNHSVHSPFHQEDYYAPLRTLRKEAMLLELMVDPKKRTPGSEFFKKRGDLFFEKWQVFETVRQLRATVGDLPIRNGLSFKRRFNTRPFSLIHSGSEGYSLTPYSYEYKDVQQERFPIIHSMQNGEIIFHSYHYDFSQRLK